VLIDPGVLGHEMAGLADDLRELRQPETRIVEWMPPDIAGQVPLDLLGRPKKRARRDARLAHGVRHDANSAQITGTAVRRCRAHPHGLW
jgi:hypothetical protein